VDERKRLAMEEQLALLTGQPVNSPLGSDGSFLPSPRGRRIDDVNGSGGGGGGGRPEGIISYGVTGSSILIICLYVDCG